MMFKYFGVMVIAMWTLALSAAPEWVMNSSGELKSAIAADGSRQVTVSVDKPKDAWFSAGWKFSAPLSDNIIKLELKAARDGMVALKVLDSTGQAGYYNFPVIGGWQRLSVSTAAADSFEGGGGPLKDISVIYFIFNGMAFQPKSSSTFWVRNLSTTKETGPEIKDYYHRNWQPAKVPPPVEGYRIETCIWNTWTPGSGWGTGDCEFNGYDQPQGMKTAKNVIDHLVKEYKYVGITLPYASGESGKEICKYLRDRGGEPLMEAHASTDVEWMIANHAFAINADGKNALETNFKGFAFQSLDITSPELLKRMQARYISSAEAGAITWRAVDYVWPWWGGPGWGYSENAVKRWRENLMGTDVGLEIDEPNGKTRKVMFAEYFASYHGYSPKPQDVGIVSWDKYVPPPSHGIDSPALRNNSKIYAMLFHYEWVKFMNEMTRYYKGMPAQPTVNPESHNNGGDYYWALKCHFFRGLTNEWWGPAGVVVPNYYNGRYYDNVAKKNRKELVELGESAAAGGSPFWGELGRPHYWDNMANYLITYSQSGSIDFKAKHDQYWASSWEKMSKPNGREFQSFTAFRSAWAGFLQCRNDRAWKPKTGVMAISQRAVTCGIEPFDVSRIHQPFSLTSHLIEQNYLHDGAAFPMDDAYNLDDYKTIWYTPFEPPAGFAVKLGDWLKRGSGRTLVTHSFIPTRYSSPQFTEPMRPGIEPGNQELVLGMPKIVKGQKKSGIIHAATPEFVAALRLFDGKKMTFANALYELSGGKSKILVAVDGVPLVSELKAGDNRIIYLHFHPRAQALGSGTVQAALVDSSMQSEEFEKAVADGVMRYLGEHPLGIMPDGVFAMKYEMPGGKLAFITYNDKASTKMRYGKEVFNTYQACDPDFKGKARLYVGQAGQSYQVEDMITLEKWNAASDAEGYVTISLDGWNMRGVYLAPTKL